MHGWGEYSDSLDLIAAAVPDAADAVITSNEDTSIRVSWSEPAYNGGSALYGFRIKLRGKDGQFSEDLVNCNGAD